MDIIKSFRTYVNKLFAKSSLTYFTYLLILVNHKWKQHLESMYEAIKVWLIASHLF